MITGLRLRFTSEEIKKHLVERAEYNRERATVKESQIADLSEIAEKLKVSQDPETVSRMTKSGYSPNANIDDTVEGLKTDIRNHRNKALAFDLFAEHLFGEDYDLGEDDLKRLEFLNRF